MQRKRTVKRAMHREAHEIDTLMKLRAELIDRLIEHLEGQGITRTSDVAAKLDLHEPQASVLLHRRPEGFRMDMLLNLAVRAGLHVTLQVAA